MQGRNYSADNYRFGYQGSEKETGVSGMYTTEYRALDVRLGRWFTPDAITQPWQSPYCSMDNNPIALNDVMGLSTVDGGGGGNSASDLQGASTDPVLALAGATEGAGSAGGDLTGNQGFAMVDFSQSAIQNSSIFALADERPTGPGSPQKKGITWNDSGTSAFEAVAGRNPLSVKTIMIIETNNDKTYYTTADENGVKYVKMLTTSYDGQTKNISFWWTKKEPVGLVNIGMTFFVQAKGNIYTNNTSTNFNPIISEGNTAVSNAINALSQFGESGNTTVTITVGGNGVSNDIRQQRGDAIKAALMGAGFTGKFIITIQDVDTHFTIQAVDGI